MKDDRQEMLNRLTFHQKLLVETIDADRYPWYRFIIERNLDEEAVRDVYALLQELEREGEKLREAGTLDRTPPLLHYVGMLHLTLDPFMTARALYEQGLYTKVTAELIELMKEKASQLKS
jgi:hypothetical protein